MTHPIVHNYTDAGLPMGCVVIDSTLRARAHGGLRMSSTVDEPELRDLARSMTLKYGYLRQPFGGAKAGVRADPEAPPEERRERLARFAEAAAPLLRSRAYVPAPDMGTDVDDIRLVLRSAGVPVSPRQLRVSRSGYYTAVTTFCSLQEAAVIAGVTLKGARATIEGFGKVGSALAGLLAAAGVRVVAISTSRGALYDPSGLDIERLTALATSSGSIVVQRYQDAQSLPANALPTLPADVLLPCAGYHSIDAAVATHIHARIVCSGANNSLTSDAELDLLRRGVVVVPDFVANCGGVLGSVLEFASIGTPEIESTLRLHTQTHVGRILSSARKQAVSPRQVAETLAMRRFQTMADGGRSGGAARVFEFGMSLYRKGLVPASLFAALARPALHRRLAWQESDGD
ncbi:MAG: hypothetical protein A2W34_08490 [Chloroflexi bacterium RBG_16_64_32]|nr:MAG: hypothetical protein A2W34_08490 [Chloroflexi bacterium RBG_16_64_32]